MPRQHMLFTSLHIKLTCFSQDPAQRQIGSLFRDTVHELVGALAAKPLRTLGWDEAELEVYLATSRKALWDKKAHCYANFISWWVQK